MVGIPIYKALDGGIPLPTYWLRWGEDMPAEVLQGLRDGKTAMLHDAQGNPYSLVLMDSTGQIRAHKVDDSLGTGGE